MQVPSEDALEAEYREAARDEAAEREAIEWLEADLGERQRPLIAACPTVAKRAPPA
jgi:hypothetical protein